MIFSSFVKSLSARFSQTAMSFNLLYATEDNNFTKRKGQKKTWKTYEANT